MRHNQESDETKSVDVHHEDLVVVRAEVEQGLPEVKTGPSRPPQPEETSVAGRVADEADTQPTTSAPRPIEANPGNTKLQKGTPPVSREASQPPSRAKLAFLVVGAVALVVVSFVVNYATNEKDVRRITLLAVVALAITLWATLIGEVRKRTALGMTAVLALILVLVATTATFLWGRSALYAVDLANSNQGWPNGSDPTGAYGPAEGGYLITPKPGYAVWRPAPADLEPSTVTVSATARLMGSGGWGVTCRQDGADHRYEFSLTHARMASIKIRSNDQPTLYQVDVDPSSENTITAECADVPGGGVHLTMWVNETKIAERYDNSQGLLGPGRSGLFAFGFGDLHAGPPKVVFTHFELRDGTADN